MFTIYHKQSPNKIRDINIAIDYHNTQKTLGDIAKKYNICRNRIHQIHKIQLRHVLQCLNKYCDWSDLSPNKHCDEFSNYLKQYRDFLLNNDTGKINRCPTCDGTGKLFISI